MMTKGKRIKKKMAKVQANIKVTAEKVKRKRTCDEVHMTLVLCQCNIGAFLF